MSIRQVTVFCASSAKVADVYFEAACSLGKLLAARGITLVYGGGAVGLMGALADTMLREGGKVIGIIPRFMVEVEWGHPHLTQRIEVESMHQRKELFLRDTDAVIALPGGCGTMEELMETITFKRLGLFTRPIVIINTMGFFDPLIDQLERMIRERFMRPEHRMMWNIITHPGLLMDALDNAHPWDSSARNFASV